MVCRVYELREEDLDMTDALWYPAIKGWRPLFPALDGYPGRECSDHNEMNNHEIARFLGGGLRNYCRCRFMVVVLYVSRNIGSYPS